MWWWWYGRCTSNAKLNGKTAIITGSNTGIGKHTVIDFCRRGARVVMACRNIQKAEETRMEVLKQLEGVQDAGVIVVWALDLTSLESVRTFADTIMREEPNIHILINNAGVMMCPDSKTFDGFEMHIGTNHLGHFLLTLLLLPRIMKSAPARIVNVTSSMYKFGRLNLDDLNWENTSYSALHAYSASKLANIVFTNELASRLEGTGVTVYAAHPGLVKTDLFRHMNNNIINIAARLFIAPFSKNIEQGAQTQIYCALDEKAGQETGQYYEDCQVVQPLFRQATDRQVAAKLWLESCKLVKIGDYDSFTPR